jgi:hypothetical protein
MSMTKTTVSMVLRKRLVFKPYHHEDHYETPCTLRPRTAFEQQDHDEHPDTAARKLSSNMYDIHRVIPSVLDPRKCEYLKDYSLDFE